MSVINNLPTWARTEAQGFKDTGHLSGDNVKRQPIPAGMQADAEAQLTGQLDQLIKSDESPLDEAKGQPGVVKVNQMGLDATATFAGDLQNGAISLEASGPITTAAYGEFNAQATSIVQVLEMGEGNYATVAARFDKQNPEASYVELKNVPEEFNIFGG